MSLNNVFPHSYPKYEATRLTCQPATRPAGRAKQGPEGPEGL